MPVFLLLQRDRSEWGQLNRDVYDEIAKNIYSLPEGKPIALLVDSPGGYAEYAYRLARLFSKHCGSYVAVVPHRAKSAATLLTLGAARIVMSRFGELGPLDAQIYDPERETFFSALDEFQVLERLNRSALTALDEQIMLFLGRTGKRVETLLPKAMQFVADMMRPLFDKIDTVHYTQTARVLRVAQAYAEMLLRPRYGEKDAEAIAQRLTESYPEHGFVIDTEEARRIGLKIETVSAESSRLVEAIPFDTGDFTVIGTIAEIKGNENGNGKKQGTTRRKGGDKRVVGPTIDRGIPGGRGRDQNGQMGQKVNMGAPHKGKRVPHSKMG